MQIGVVDYGVGNIANVMRCLEYVARTESIKRVSTHKDIQACDKIILPGVGAFGSAMEHLSARDLDKTLCEYAKSGRYMLGICLGMQLLFEKSYEFGEHKGLGLVEGFVAPFGSKDSIEWHIKTNMGFNDIESKGLDSTKSYPTPNNHSIEIESRFYKVCTHPNGRESRFDTRCTQSPEYTHKDKETRFYENTPQNTTLTQVSEKLDSKTMACHTEPLGEVSNTKSKKDISCLHTQYDKNLDSSKNCTLNTEPARVVGNLESCHVECSETSSIDSIKDFSPFSKARTKQAIAHTCKNDKILESTKTTDSINSTNQTIRNLDSIKFAPLHPAPTHLVENLESIYTNIQTLYTTNNNKAQNTHLKIPHIGWNKNFIKKPHNLCASMKDSFYLYFVHSYHVCCDTRFIIAACDYGISFPSIIGKENILGIQPHPERSHEMGFKLMRDFLQLR